MTEINPTKRCYDCKHMRIDYEGDWSDVTPGRGLTIECYHPRVSNDLDDPGAMDRIDLKRVMDAAISCEHFEDEAKR